MVRVNIPTLACDICHRNGREHGVTVEPVEIRLGEVRFKGDICEEDSAPIRELLKRMPARRSRRQRFEDSVVADPSQIPRDGKG